jgi:hypothetical protein
LSFFEIFAVDISITDGIRSPKDFQTWETLIKVEYSVWDAVFSTTKRGSFAL